MPRPHIHKDSHRSRNDRVFCSPSSNIRLMFDPAESGTVATAAAQGNELVDRLRGLLRQSPDLTASYLDELRQKINDGTYLTREAAELSAERMLDDGDV